MNVTFGKLKELGMETISIANVDERGRIVIPSKIRKKAGITKYSLCVFKDMIILRGC